MRVPLAWLKEYVRISLAPSALAEVLTQAGIEVEGIIDRRKDFANVVVGEVVELKSHPNADKLRLAYVRVAKNAQPQEIVCGAPNIAVGQKVAVALLGAVLPNGLKIEARKIRGIASNGMVCAEDELGLGTSHAGVMILEPTLEVGMSFAEAMGFDDVVLDVSVPSNRSDVLSIRGLAREVAAVTGVAWKDVPVKLKESSVSAAKSITVKIATPGCSRFTARVIRGVTLRSSPEWLVRRLRQAGMRSVNAVVDVTNYVMLSYGQPLHAYDAATLSGKILTARDARLGEQMTTLDGHERKLDPSMLVIADAAGAVDLAGVMGSLETEIRATTTDIVLEAARFDHVRVRRTSWKLGLQSEASRRFEKGLPLGLQEEASTAAAALIVQICGGTVEKGFASAGPASAKPTMVTLDPRLFGDILGKSVPPAKAKTVLTRLGCVVKGTAKQWNVRVPAWRLDIAIPEDLVEEVGRMIGYNDLPEVLPPMNIVPHRVPELLQLKDAIRDVLVGFGYIETLSHAFYGPTSISRMPAGEHVRVANPLDASQQYLRRSIVPQLERTLELSADRGEDARVFEIGRVFLSTQSPIEKQQPWRVAIGVAMKASKGYVSGRTVRGVVGGVCAAVGATLPKFEVHVREVKGRVIEVCELEIASLRDMQQLRVYEALPTFPAAVRDLAVWVPAAMTYTDLEKAIIQAGGELLESVELFDVFDRDQRRSLAFRLTFRATDRTLTDEQISATLTVIMKALLQLGAELR